VKNPYLVAYDYGQGAVWAFVVARSEQEIEREFPELTVVREPPVWMDEAQRRRIAARMTFDIDERVVGWLAKVLEERNRASGGPRSLG
jgi:hypothetical protein